MSWLSQVICSWTSDTYVDMFNLPFPFQAQCDSQWTTYLLLLPGIPPLAHKSFSYCFLQVQNPGVSFNIPVPLTMLTDLILNTKQLATIHFIPSLLSFLLWAVIHLTLGELPKPSGQSPSLSVLHPFLISAHVTARMSPQNWICHGSSCSESSMAIHCISNIVDSCTHRNTHAYMKYNKDKCLKKCKYQRVHGDR